MKQMTDNLLQNFQNSSKAITTGGNVDFDIDEDRIWVNGEGWHLIVYKDGTNVRYRNYGYQERIPKSQKATGKVPENKLEALGRKFIAQELAPYY
ncbi:MAG: hypothetical protein AB1847_05945 [bacterium]